MRKALALLLAAVLLLSGCGGAGNVRSNSMQSSYECFGIWKNFARFNDRLLIILNNGLYRTNLDGGERKLLADGCGSIEDATNDFIIYSYRGAIYRVDWNGSGKKTLADITGSVMGCTNRWIYYTDYNEQGLHRVSVDGQRKEDTRGKYVMNVSPDKSMALIIEPGRLLLASDDSPEPAVLLEGGAQNACWCGDKIFISGTNNLLRYDITSGTLAKLTDAAVFHLQSDENNAYYIDRELMLNSLKADATTPVKLTKDKVLVDYAFKYETKPYIAEDGWVYFRGIDTKLYRASSDGKTTQRLTDTTVRPVNVANGFIYFINFKDNTEPGSDMILYSYDSSVYRMNLDGSGKRRFVLPENGMTGQLIVIDDRLYFNRQYQIELPREAWKTPKAGGEAVRQDFAEIRGYYFSWPKDLLRTDSLMFYSKPDTSGVYCSNLDGSGEYQISKLHGWDYIYIDRWLYFQNRDGIYRVSRESGGVPELLFGIDVSGFMVCGNKLLYLDDSGKNERGIYIGNVDGTDLRRIVAKDDAHLIGAEDGWIYYSTGPFPLYKIGMDGSGEQAIIKDSTEPFMNPALSDGHIYFCNDKMPCQISRVNCDTAGIERLAVHYTAGGAFQFDEDYVYYIKGIQEGIWRMNMKSLKEEQVVNGKATDFKLEGDTIYFIFEGRGDALDVVPLK